MGNETKFIDGLIVKAPNERAPEYVKAKLSIKRQELIAWLQAQQGEWVNVDIKVSQQGKWYAAVDDWKPNQESKAQRNETPVASTPADDFADDAMPF